jgi:hypothetical protein
VKLEAQRIVGHGDGTEPARVGRREFGAAHLPGIVSAGFPVEHERSALAESRYLSGHLQAHRSGRDERDGEGEILLVLVLPRRGVLPYLVVLELGCDLVVGDALFERLALPPFFPDAEILSNTSIFDAMKKWFSCLTNSSLMSIGWF